MPIKAGISNASRDRMKVKIRTASTLGNASGKVTFLKTCQPVLPAVVAASSSEGSMERKGVDINRKTIGIQRKLSTKIIPCMEKILSRGEPVIGMTKEFRIP